jgi:hypothetical protein
MAASNTTRRPSGSVVRGSSSAILAGWLPDLHDGALGTIAFFAVCGLCGTVVAIVGIDTYLIVREAERSSREFTLTTTAGVLVAMLGDRGTVAGSH